MKRELKFRAWDTIKIIFVDEGEITFYFYGDSHIEVHPNSITYIGDQVHNGEPEEQCRFIIQQYTGLKDKNGKEAYEGDIVSTPHFFNWTITGYEKRRIFFKDGAFGVKENEHGFIALKSLFKGIESSKTYISNYGEIYREFEPMFEVIGNIYENPELLGGEND